MNECQIYHPHTSLHTQTFLGCRGEAKILDAVRRCCASLYAFQSVEYRRQNGQPVVTGMGVVVQEMAEAEAAGVMFTRDPVSGNPERIVITANYGLGEVRRRWGAFIQCC